MPRPNAGALTLLAIVALILLLVALMPRKAAATPEPPLTEGAHGYGILGSLLNPDSGLQDSSP